MNENELNICSYSKKCEQFINIFNLNDEKKIFKWQILNSRNIQNLIFNFVYFNPGTKEELKKVIRLWYENKEKAINKYGDINTWNVSNITDMSDLFRCCYEFNDNINNWDVSNVTNMKQMFDGCEKFNQPLNNWLGNKVPNLDTKCQRNVSNVTNMAFMFYQCKKLKSKPNWYTSTCPKWYTKWYQH